VVKMGRDFFGPGFVTELCQHCGHEITLLWDTTILGFEAVCPVCGSRLMLCDECRHAAESGPCDYNRETNSCCRRERRRLWMRLGVSLAVTRYEEAAILGDDSELAEKTLHRLLAEGRFTPDGDSYIPGGVVLAFNKEHGTEYSARDISLDV